MIVPIIMAIWFGVTAYKAGRNWFAWGLGGAVLAFIVGTIVVNLGALMFGSFSLDGYIAFRIISAVVAIAITILIGRKLMATLKKKTVTTDS